MGKALLMSTPVRLNCSCTIAMLFCSGINRQSMRRVPAPPTPSLKKTSPNSNTVATREIRGVVQNIRARRPGRANTIRFSGPATMLKTARKLRIAAIGSCRGPNTAKSC